MGAGPAPPSVVRQTPINDPAACKALTTTQTYAGDSNLPTADPTKYSQMSVDLFNHLNQMRTDPTTYAVGVSAPAQTVVNTYTAKPAWIWSNSLMNAALKYVNDKGPDGSAARTSAFLTGRNLYLSTVCDNYEFELTHTRNS